MTTRRLFMSGSLTAAGTIELTSGRGKARAFAGPGPAVASRSALSELDAASSSVAYLLERGRAGWFAFNPADLSREVAADPSQGIFIARADHQPDDKLGERGAWVRQFDADLNVKWFGAAGDGRSDDTAALQSAFDAAQALGLSVLLPHGTYRTTYGLKIRQAITLQSQGAKLYFDTSNPDIALEVTTASGALLSRPRILGHLAIENAKINWAIPSCGLKLQNCYMGEFHVSVLNFQRGIWLRGDEAGCVYNDVHISQLTNNQYSTYLDTASAKGWCNQNTFWSGRYSNGILEPGSHIEIDDLLYSCNGNSWVRPSLEAISDAYRLFNLMGQHNSILHPRCEHGGKPGIYGEIGGRKNEVLAHSSPYLTEARVKISGVSSRLETSVGSVWQYQSDYGLERRGVGPVLSLRNVSQDDGLEILAADGRRSVHISAGPAWEVGDGKKIIWRAETPPSSGEWLHGDIAFKATPSGEGQLGWVCTKSGTPGVWEAFGLVGATKAERVEHPGNGSVVDTECRSQLIDLIESLKASGLMA